MTTVDRINVLTERLQMPELNPQRDRTLMTGPYKPRDTDTSMEGEALLQIGAIVGMPKPHRMQLGVYLAQLEDAVPRFMRHRNRRKARALQL